MIRPRGILDVERGPLVMRGLALAVRASMRHRAG